MYKSFNSVNYVLLISQKYFLSCMHRKYFKRVIIQTSYKIVRHIELVYFKRRSVQVNLKQVLNYAWESRPLTNI